MLIASFVYFSFVYFFFLDFSSFVYFLSLHTLSAQTYLITFWLQGFHDFFLIVFFLPVSLKKIMISWYSWFFLTVSMLILHGPSFLFQMRFRGDGFSIHIYDALVWCKVFFSICCWCKSQIFFVWWFFRPGPNPATTRTGIGTGPVLAGLEVCLSTKPVFGLFHLEQDLKKLSLISKSHNF